MIEDEQIITDEHENYLDLDDNENDNDDEFYDANQDDNNDQVEFSIETMTKDIQTLEKEFLRQIIAIVPYIMFLFLIFTLSAKHAYVDLRLESNENLKDWIQNHTEWNSVGSFQSYLSN